MTTAWLDKKHGRYRIRWYDPVAKKPNGDPICRAASIKPPARTLDAARPHLDKFNARLPPSPPRARVHGVRPMEKHTLLKLGMLWYDLHAGHSSRAAYINAVRTLCRPVDEGGMAVVWPEELTKAGIEQWKEKRGNKGCDRLLAYIRAILRWCHEAKYAPALDDEVDKVMAAPQSGRARVRLLTDAEYAETMAIAKAHGHFAIAHCLSTYGWRPITACRLTVGMVDAVHGTVRGLHRKVVNKKAKAQEHAHRLLPETRQLLAPLLVDRDPAEPVFVYQGGAWPTPRGRAADLASWYRGYCRNVAPDAGGIYAWKRYAIYQMKAGLGPWAAMKRPLTSAEAIVYTGHQTAAMIDLYMRPGDMDVLFDGADEDLVLDENEGETGASTGGDKGAFGSYTMEQAGTDMGQVGPVVIQFKAEWTQVGQYGTR